MNNNLSLEKSKILIDSGVSPDAASLILWTQVSDWENKPIEKCKWNLVMKPFRPAVMGFESFKCFDIFSVSDLIKLCPPFVVDGNGVRHGFYMKRCGQNFEHFDVGYAFTDDYYEISYVEDTFADALFKLHNWVKENGHFSS